MMETRAAPAFSSVLMYGIVRVIKLREQSRMTKLEELKEAARALTAEERAELIEVLWDTLDPDSTAPAMPDWHRVGLDQRLAEHEADPHSAVPWEEARERLMAGERM